MKFVPVFNIQETKFFRYELPVNHEIILQFAPIKNKKNFYF
jgi:hypothetical protein